MPRKDIMEKVKAKKHLGQHFLTDENIAKKIADTLQLEGYDLVLEIGPGMGVLTKYLLEKDIETYVIEIDTESVEYLNAHYPKLHGKIISKDFQNFGITFPENEFMQKGSRTGYHTEYFGFILCELQYMQRTYPNCVW